MKLTAEDKRTCGMAAAGLLEREDYQHLLRRPGPKRTRRPSLLKAIRTARKAGVDRGTVTVGNVSVSFGESEPTEAVNPWLVGLDEVTKQ